MMKIEAIIRSSVLHETQHALSEIGLPTFSTYQVQLTGIHKGHTGLRNKASDFIPKTKFEILCSDKDADKIINTIQTSANTGEKGDGLVFAYHVDKIVKIRNGETSEDAV